MLSTLWPLLALCGVAAGDRPVLREGSEHRGDHLGVHAGLEGEEDAGGDDEASPACDKPGTILESKEDRTLCVNYAYGQCTDLDPDACEGLAPGACGEDADVSEKSAGICKKPDAPEGEETIYTAKGCCPKSCGECTAAEEGLAEEGKPGPSDDTPDGNQGAEEEREGEDENADETEGRKKEIKAYIKKQVQNFLAQREEGEDADEEPGDDERHLEVIKELEADLEAMNQFHDHDKTMRLEMERLDLMDPAQVDELGKYSEDFAKCMFRCIHSAHEYFSSEAAARESCECTVVGGLRQCDECQYLADDKVTDRDGEAIEVESPHATSHISDNHFEGKTSRGRCVLPGDVPEARQINFHGEILQC